MFGSGNDNVSIIEDRQSKEVDILIIRDTDTCLSPLFAGRKLPSPLLSLGSLIQNPFQGNFYGN